MHLRVAEYGRQVQGFGNSWFSVGFGYNNNSSLFISLSVDSFVLCTIIDFPNTGITYNGGWCSATIPR